MKRTLAALALAFAFSAPAVADLEDDCRFVASWVHAVATDRDNGAQLADTVREIDRAVTAGNVLPIIAWALTVAAAAVHERPHGAPADDARAAYYHCIAGESPGVVFTF